MKLILVCWFFSFPFVDSELMNKVAPVKGIQANRDYPTVTIIIL
jgi:hypothetical protein